MSNIHQNRRSSFSSSTKSSLAKRQAPSSSENSVKPMAVMTKKRAPLSNITNQKNGSRLPNSSSDSVHCSNKSAKLKLAPTQPVCVNAGFSNNVLPLQQGVVPHKVASSPSKSDDGSVSMDETMSSSDSYKSPQVEYIDNDEVSAVVSIERKALSNLYITPTSETIGNYCSRDVLSDMKKMDKNQIVNIDNNNADPQLCATFACDIYKHLRASEAKKRPVVDYMERVQKDVNSSMRGILVDWLIEVSEEYRLVPETLYLTVNYIDRYLSGNVISRQKLQLLGVACMMIAAKYEEICAPQVEEFCYITDNTYLKDEVLDMESDVLNYLKFEMTAPTTKCFLRRFVRAAHGVHEAPLMQLECMANYIAELSLLEYTMLSHSPSLVAASAIFLAKYILDPTRRPWNSTLQHYTQYKATELRGCVKDLQRLCSTAHGSTLPAVREKYSQHKYKFVAKKFCPSIIPQDPLPTLPRSLLKPPPGVTPYWFTLFGGEKYFTDEMLLSKLQKSKTLNSELRVKYACLLLVDGLLGRRSFHMMIPREHVEMIRDLDVFLKYPWGRYSFDMTMQCIKSRSLPQLAQATVAIQGFIHALVLVFVEAVPAVLSAVGDRVEPEYDDEDVFPVISLKLDKVWELDGEDQVDVLSIIPSADVITGVEDCGWVDEVSDPSV
ncbi:Cyclin-like superfamily [Arabidopsis suecica]|uniref:Cyclin-like superfamily n=1 Tax=Arabidopsis suecica TaxID=45249 RepID=A0A8T2CJ82_ARASU|nr:Cyclin-like superfamily [Arabidopsis suecica]